MNEYVEPVGSITVSTPEICWFICAICSSFSKSETARKPFTITVAPTCLGDVDGEGLHRHDADVAEVLHALGDAFHPSFDGQQGFRLSRVPQNRDDDAVKQAMGAFDHFKVPVVERIEGSGEQRCRHRPSSGPASGTRGDFTATVTSVPP